MEEGGGACLGGGYIIPINLSGKNMCCVTQKTNPPHTLYITICHGPQLLEWPLIDHVIQTALYLVECRCSLRVVQ